MVLHLNLNMNLHTNLHTSMPHDHDWRPDKKYKKLWWKLLIVSGTLLLLDIFILILSK